MPEPWNCPARRRNDNALCLLLACILLALSGTTQAVGQTREYSDSLIAIPGANNPQFLKHADGRQQLVYTVESEYPAENVLRLISTELKENGWQPLREDFLNPAIPTSYVRGWQQFEDAAQKPAVMVRQWMTDWENARHDVTRYDLLYKSPYPETRPPNLREVQVLALYIPSAVARKMKSETTPSITMHCRVTVPTEYRKTPFNPPPNGQPEPGRYTVAYEAFWWNCVAVRAANLQGRCPFMASGTPAASAGAKDGASNADSQIDRLLKTHGAAKVQKYLQSISSTPAAKQKMHPYFDEPTPDVVN